MEERKEDTKKVKEAIKKVNDAEKNEDQKNGEAAQSETTLKSKMEVEKVKADTEIKKEKKEEKAKASKLDPSTPAEVWTANMPEHHLEGYVQKNVPKDKALNQVEEESDSDSDDDE